ncbi:MAG TPA: hypothetical protein VHZ99_00570 [Steroidobacteraceae bacterium]|jgi:hypothetical protein|nr:hypothetical protein [Steroidobacteraceae bacterium]
MLLQPLQDMLAGIYDLPMQYCVDDFLVTERAQLPAAVRDTETDEQVVVVEAAEAGEPPAVGLFLDPRLLARLAAANPIEALNAGNVADYWTALEGVSHFICLAWNAEHDRAVSLLELELQAEIDKYVTSWWLLCEQDPTRHPAELHRLLFERCRVDEALAGDRVQMYREANRYAARFCHRMQQLLAAENTGRSQALCELRRFYRLSQERKMTHIRRYGE